MRETKTQKSKGSERRNRFKEILTKKIEEKENEIENKKTKVKQEIE